MIHRFIKLLLFTLIIITIVQLVPQLPSLNTFDQAWVDSHTRDNGLTGVINFVFISVFLLSMGLPRQIAAFLGGYAFGFVEGMLYSTIAATVSCILLLLFSRYFARPTVTRIFKTKVQPINHFLAHDPLIKSIIIRLLPIGNNVMTNLIAGVSKINAFPFIAGSAIGYVPQMTIFSLMGKGVVINSELKISISIILFGLSGALGARLLKKYRFRPADNAKRTPTIRTH